MITEFTQRNGRIQISFEFGSFIQKVCFISVVALVTKNLSMSLAIVVYSASVDLLCISTNLMMSGVDSWTGVHQGVLTFHISSS